MQVRFYATLRAIVGAKTIDVPLGDGSTVRDLAEVLVELYPGLREHVFDADGHIARTVHFMIDGRNTRWLDGEATRLEPDQSIDVFPPVAGG
ncbi:MAG: MoaD/ThiS family protein [Actinomycetota bacterium]|nr:MoaD/ThiS family protein [Actinomycetota bacterium]